MTQTFPIAIKERAATIEVRPSVHRAFNETLQDRMTNTVWKSGCQSWYLEAERWSP